MVGSDKEEAKLFDIHPVVDAGQTTVTVVVKEPIVTSPF